MTTILSDAGATEVTAARAGGDALWLPAAHLEEATGWTLKPEGLCRGEVCVPLPPGATQELARDDMLDVAAIWRRLGKPVLASDDGDIWVLGESAATRTAALESLEASDFALPDLDGNLHRLSDHRGEKVLLATWASW